MFRRTTKFMRRIATIANSWKRRPLLAAAFACLLLSLTNAALAQAAVQIFAPANQASVSGTVMFTCQSSSGKTVSENLFVDSALLSSQSHSAPGGFTFSYPWDTTTVANGAHTLVCKAYKGNGSILGTASVSVTVNNNIAPTSTPGPTPTPTSAPTSAPTPTATPTSSGAPTTTIMAPISGTSVAGTVPFTCAATSGQIAWENLFVDSAWLATSPSNSGGAFTYSSAWNTTALANGVHTLVCRGYNSSGGTLAVATAGVMVSNGVPDPSPTSTMPPTSTATPTPVPSPTPTPIATATPTSAPTPSVIPTATSTPSPASTPTPSSAPTPTLAPTSTPTTAPTPAPTPTARTSLSATLSVGSTAQTTNVSRIGINLGNWTLYGAEQFSSNVIMNPGFEPTIDRTIVIVQDVSGSGFSDNAAWLARPNGFWNGASFQVLTGNWAGTTGTIASSLATGSDGLPWFTTAGPAPALATGDAVSVTQTQTSGEPASWWIQAPSQGYVAINTSDHRPGSPGSSVAELTLQSGQPTEIISFLDSTGVGKFLLVNGSWQLSFWARSTSGNPNLTVTFERLGQSPFAQQTVTLTPAWTQTVINFTASDTGPISPLMLQFSAAGVAGSAVRLDDVQLGRTSDLLAGGFRAEVIGALQNLHPGYLRDWQFQSGDTLHNRLANAFGRGPSRWVPDSANNMQNFLYSLPDFLALCAQLKAQPWIVVPTTFYDSEFTALGHYLAQAQSTYNFREIVVEFGDENWNGVFRSASIGDAARMGQAANRAFTLLRAAAGASVPLHLDVNGQFVNIGVGQQAITNAPQADAVDVAPYYFYSLDSTTPQSTAISQMLDESDEPSLISQLAAWTQPLGKSIDIYEVNASTVQGNAPQSQRDPIVAGAVSGTALASRLLTGLLSGVNRQCAFDLAQYDMSTSNGMTALWGIAHDLTASTNFRPTGLAVQMLNTAMSGDFYPVTVSGASGLTAAAFWSTAGWSLALTSSNSSPVTVTIALPGGGTAPTRALLLSAPTPTSTNESGPQVGIAQAALGSNLTLTVPAYGLAVLLPPNNPP